MASSEEVPPSEPSAEAPLEAVAKVEEALAEEPVAMEVEETLAPMDDEKSLQTNGYALSGENLPPGEGNSEKTLEHAAELFEKGSKAIEDGDFVEAVDCLSRALEIRVTHYGELAPECAISYYKYGCALLCKAQEEADPLVDVPKNLPKNTGKDRTLDNAEEGGSSKICISDANLDASSNNLEVEEVCSDKDQEDDKEGSDDDGEESAEADDDSDLDMAWKMLELARAIVEKQPEDTMEKVNILSALGEVSAEREDIVTSLNDYLKALSILERLVEPDHRRMVELNFRICLVLEVESKIEDAIPYCQKAISLCKSHLQRLSEDSASTALSENNVNPVPDLDRSSGSNPSVLENETELLSGILTELERKLEDMQQAMATPKSAFAEVMKMVASRSASAEIALSATKTGSFSLNSSQVGVSNSGFDSPTISTAATNDGVTHLGVVGRGIKRAVVNALSAGPFPKKSLLDMSADKDESSVSEVTDSTAIGAETSEK